MCLLWALGQLRKCDFSYCIIYKAVVACALLLVELGRVQKRLFLCLADAQLTRRSLQFGMYSFHQPTTAVHCQYCQRQNQHCAYAKLGTCGLQIRSMCLRCFVLRAQFLASFNTTSSTREFKRKVLRLASESKSVVLGSN